MERTTTIKRAKQLLKGNFIGLDELTKISEKLGISISEHIKKNIPTIQFSEDFLLSLKDEYILIIGIPYFKDGSPLTIVKMREHFGYNPEIFEPCFYNQDWYLNEEFANICNLKIGWYLIRKNVFEETRGLSPELIMNKMREKQNLPSALLATYCFFSSYLLNSNEILWKNDYIWCSDFDHNGDRIYVGRYKDSENVNKNGFSIHRHLAIRQNYGIINNI